MSTASFPLILFGVPSLGDGQARALEFERPAAVIVKHNNPCGAAEQETLEAAYLAALASDPVSAFGGVIAFNRAMDAKTADEAIDIISRNPYGNAASIFTSNGATARKFRYEIPAGNVGVNIGIAAPMAYFPFSGWKDSFMGVLHGQGKDGVEFYTDKKVVVERWPKEWSRKF